MYSIVHIYVYVKINTSISIHYYQESTNFPEKLLFGFGVYIPDWIVHRFKHGTRVITVWIITSTIQWWFSQYKCFVIIWIKYPIYSNNNCMVYIEKYLHQLDQVYTFNDIVKNIKITLYIKLLYLITNTLTIFIYYLVNNNCVRKYDFIRITIWLTY